MAPEKNRDVDPFTKLQGYTNAILLKSGRLFRDPRKRNGPHMLSIRRELKKTLPGILSSYHDVLDGFDTELQLARRALAAELAVRQEERLQRERAEEESKRKAAQAAPPVKPPPATTKVKDTPKSTSEDVIMLDGPMAGANRIGTQVYTDQGKPQETIANSANGSNGQAKKRAQPEAISIPSPKEVAGNGGIDLTSAGGLDDLFEGQTPTTANKDFDLDSIFNDMTTDGDASMKGGADVGDIDFNFSNGPSDSAGGVSSLLPGLENYSSMETSVTNQENGNVADFSFDLPSQNNASSSAATNGMLSSANDIAVSTGDTSLDELLHAFDDGNDAGLDLDGENGQFGDNFWGS